MALDSSRLATAIENGVRSSQSLGVTSYPQLTAYCQALASAIVTEITANAQINNGLANGLTGVINTTEPNINKSPISNVPVTGGII